MENGLQAYEAVHASRLQRPDESICNHQRKTGKVQDQHASY